MRKKKTLEFHSENAYQLIKSEAAKEKMRVGDYILGLVLTDMFRCGKRTSLTKTEITGFITEIGWGGPNSDIASIYGGKIAKLEKEQ